MKYLQVMLVTTLVSVSLCLAQDSTRVLKWELSGSVSYSYNSLNQENSDRYFPGSSFSYTSKSHVVGISPRLGYFVTPELEPLFEISYTYAWTEATAPFYNPFTQYLDNSTIKALSHSVGVGIGGAYNGRVSDLVTLFGGAKVDAHWTYSSSKWSKREMWFPMVFVGTKIFISPSWALIGQMEYDHANSLGGLDGATMDGVALSGGFAVYLQ